MMAPGKNGVIRMTPPYLRRRAPAPPIRNDHLVGEVSGHRAGYGFVLVNHKNRFFLGEEEMNRVLDGDLVRIANSYNPQEGKEYARVVEILARKRRTVFGYYHEDGGESYLIPCNKRIPRAIYIEKPTEPIGENDVVEVKVLTKNGLELPQKLRGELVGFVRPKEDARLETDIAINTYGLEFAFPSVVLREADSFSDSIEPSAHSNREDFTAIPFVTMDGKDARDYDDAVFCRKEGDIFRLMVAVADVSHYVRPDSLLDKSARLRTSSVYFPDRVLPMLPERLSNGLCSLNPQCNRLAMVCEILIGPNGKRQKVNFHKAVIRSQARLIYDDVAELMKAGNSSGEATNPEQPALPQLSKEVHSSLACLKELTEVLLKARDGRGALDFNHLEETQVEISSQGRVDKVSAYQRSFAHRMIEEAMLAANDATAWFLSKKGVPFLYRIHKAPKREDFAELVLFLSNYGIRAPEGYDDKISTRVYDYLLKAISKFPEVAVLEAKILRSLQRAEYARKNYGHFGLNYKSYTHFTSPIRRYADLMVHRAIKKVTVKEGSGRSEYPYAAGEVTKIGAVCTQQERIIEQAVWQALDGLKCRYLTEHQKPSYKGVITTVLEFGFYVRFNELPIEGFVHVRNFRNDYYQFDGAGQKLVGRRRRREYKLGGAIEFRIKNINIAERKIDLAPI